MKNCRPALSGLSDSAYASKSDPRGGMKAKLTICLAAALLPLVAVLFPHHSSNDSFAAGQEGFALIRHAANSNGLPVYTRININRIAAWYHAWGIEESAPTSTPGLTYPKGTAGTIFATGLLWSGLHRDGLEPLVRSNGHMYNTGLQPGAILGERTGVAEDRLSPDVRIWRIRRDFFFADLRQDAASVLGVDEDNVTDEQIEQVRSQYELDWLEWPAHKGAPFYDADANGLYEPSIVDGVPVLFPEADEPGIAGADQVIWYTANDLQSSGSPWGGSRAGIEMQQTIWAFDRPDGLGDVAFKKYRFIYKGLLGTADTARIDSMFFGMWSDPDLGSAIDDFAGCDSLLQVGYCYNGVRNDSNYDYFGIPPPAIGYVLLQGPLVPGEPGEDRNRNGIDDGFDTGIFDLQETGPGSINLPMTSFVYMATGDLYSDPPFTAAGGLQLSCMLQGYPPTPQPPPCPMNVIDPRTGDPAPRFGLYGNPLTGEGWIDGLSEGPGDRRFVMGVGPFTIAIGDTQELVVGVVGGLGRDHFDSITRFKSNARLAQIAFKDLFKLPGPPARPVVQGVGFDRQILIDWESDVRGVTETEDSIIAGVYRFEGYKVYQYPDETRDSSRALLLAQVDVKNGVTAIAQLMPDPVTGELFLRNVQYGSDNGITRTLAVSRDVFRDSSELVNGREYYFGVSSYNYTADSLLQIRTYESSPSYVTLQPEAPKPGTRYPYSIGDTIATVTQVAGFSEVLISPIVYNPEKQEGDVYRILFDTADAGNLTWDLTNHITGQLIYTGLEDLSGAEAFRVSESGFDVSVMEIGTGVITVTDQNGDTVLGRSIFSPEGTIESFGGTSVGSGFDYEIRFGETSFALNRSLSTRPVRVPFAVYELARGDSIISRPIMSVVHDRNGVSDWGLVPGGHEVGDTVVQAFEPISSTTYAYVADDPTTTEREDSAAVQSLRDELLLASMGYTRPDARQAFFSLFIADTQLSGLPPSEGLVRIRKHHPLLPGDEYEIQLQSLIKGDAQLAKGDIAAINVFPNPFYGANSDETASSGPFVTFSHLPARAVIRIYNLAGIHVRKLEKDDPDTQYYRWNLRNEQDKPVGSGIYLVYIELKDSNGADLGTKTLKLVVIQGTR